MGGQSDLCQKTRRNPEPIRLKPRPTHATNEGLDKVIHVYSSLDALKTDEYLELASIATP